MNVYGMDDYIYSDIGSERFFLCLINNSSYVPLHASKLIFLYLRLRRKEVG